ncbi:hypothetical protein DACRYDRAFT_108951 [Dacryopinax primogenitus]|uniref:PIH1 N-terminal domain-containing protein n=1 Tax=Dacryopinax primogenitus (strain DJM 731) TaxID=1858805 RepID=M5FVB2_DACPD|nr:uncharacterized protein DACRYDRAFT_108951 [Dacryopinax primogenitus]EJU00204.1 hypothetical protein DACRYDRAFT_108951 [Dacryopinax primogenitus]
MVLRAVQYAISQPNTGKTEIIDVPAGRKTFINVCWDEHIPPPADVPESTKQRAMQGEENTWGVPHVVGDGRTDEDRADRTAPAAGHPALVFDTIFHPSLSARAKSDLVFREFIKQIAIGSVEDKSGLSLSREASIPKLASKGVLLPRTAIVPVPVPKRSIEVLSDTPDTPFLAVDPSSSSSTLPGPASTALTAVTGGADADDSEKQVPSWRWEEADNGMGVRIVTRAQHPKTTLDLEPRRLILSSPAFATLDTSLSTLPRDLDVHGAHAEYNLLEHELVLNATWA